VIPLIDDNKYSLLDYLKKVRSHDCDLDFVFANDSKLYHHKLELKTQHYKVKKYMRLAEIDTDERKSGFHALSYSNIWIFLDISFAMRHSIR